MKLRELLSNRVIRNGKWMVGEQMVQLLISVVVSVLTARYLGPSNYGIINYCATYVAFFTSVCSLGLEGVLVRELVRHPEKEGTLVGTSLIMRLITGALSMGAISLILLIVDRGDTLIMTVGLLQSIVLVARAFDVLDFWFQSKLRSKYVAIIKMISYFIVAAYKVFILATEKPVEWFAFTTSLDFCIIGALLVWIYFRNSGPRMHFSFEIAKMLLRESYHFIISGLLVMFYSYMDKIMIEKMLGDAAAGHYSLGTTIFNYWAQVSLAIINAARPSIMEQHKSNKALYLKRTKQLYAVLWWSSILVAVFFTVCGRWIVPLLYGESYLPAVDALTITMWYAPLSVLGTARGIWVVCEGKNRYVKYFMVIGALVNLVLNIALIPLWGINGAAVATFVTQAVVCVIAPLFFRETRIHSRYVLESLFLIGIR